MIAFTSTPLPHTQPPPHTHTQTVCELLKSRPLIQEVIDFCLKGSKDNVPEYFDDKDFIRVGVALGFNEESAMLPNLKAMRDERFQAVRNCLKDAIREGE